MVNALICGPCLTAPLECSVARAYTMTDEQRYAKKRVFRPSSVRLPNTKISSTLAAQCGPVCELRNFLRTDSGAFKMKFRM